MWETVELHEIRTFLVLAEELHFGRTAVRLHLTQSRVSQILRGLESRIGGPLLARTSRRVALTPLGDRLLAEIRRPYDDLRTALARVEGEARGVVGELRLGFIVQAVGGPAFPEIVRRFEERHPLCRLTTVEMGVPPGPLSMLRAGTVDLLAMRLPLDQPDITVGPLLSRETRILAVARNHPLAGRAEVTLEDLGDYAVADVPLLPSETEAEFMPRRTPSGRPIARGAEAATVSEIFARVAMGSIVHPTVPSVQDYYGNPGIVYVPIVDAPTTTSALVWMTATQPPAAEAFVATANEVLTEKGIE
jgi:DNA-binding transcriptional LysR family regulator